MTSTLSRCPSCAGVVPAVASACPHCEAPLSRKSSLGKLALGVLGGLGASMTLMACYGAPPSSCYETVKLPDGGTTTDYVCGVEPADAGPRADAGATDGGTTDGGRTDGGP